MHARFLHQPRLWLLALLATAAPAPLAAQAAATQAAAAQAAAPAESVHALPAPERIRALRDYIKKTWTTLRRSARDLPAAAQDPKLHLPPGSRCPVYLPAAEDQARIEAALRAELGVGGLSRIELRRLPADTRELREHGLLYLPHPYVVPGGRFNEMYGWDSYFILLGLLRDDEVAAARDMVDNFLYEIEHYGTILNANRTYYLTRSQPPFLTRMLLGVFARTSDRAWLEASVAAAERHYRFWTSEPHLVPATGLSRYYDLGEGPAPEVLSDERDAQGRSHYDRVREYYRTHETSDYDEARFYDAKADRLTPLFYKGDRSMRESGFDPSNRFGPMNVDITDYVPVCLNALLYQMERDLAEIGTILGDGEAAKLWEARAAERRERMERLSWDEDEGLYLDYNFVKRARRKYPFATTFYPLWVGAASPARAARVARGLARFEAQGGLLTSTTASGNQWDAPFGWAPLQLVAVDGLRRYGHQDDASRIARKFITLVTREFERSGTIVEKYDVVRGATDVAGDIRFGYAENQVGFGWTNGVYLELLAGLEAPSEPRRR
jgi:alpha,alpha-trehalase